MLWESRKTWEFSTITACASPSIPGFVAVTRDEFWVWVGWKVAGLWVTQPQDISMFRNLGGRCCSSDNVAVFVLHQKTLNVILLLTGFLAVKFEVSKWILVLTLMLCSVNSETLILTRAGLDNCRKIQMCVCQDCTLPFSYKSLQHLFCLYLFPNFQYLLEISNIYYWNFQYFQLFQFPVFPIFIIGILCFQ